MSGAGFGRKGAAPNSDLTARRAAFLAEERARASAAPAGGGGGSGIGDSFVSRALADRPYVSRKTMSTAYLLWFFLGGFSAHRFYLGFRTSAIIQMLLTPLGYAMVMNKSPAGLFAVPAAALWIVVDVFLIPGMVAKANERARENSLAAAFT
jgi:TM2 domain-containing membrane protein YozV